MRAARALLAATEKPAVAIVADAKQFLDISEKHAYESFRAASAASLSTTLATRTSSAGTRASSTTGLSWSRVKLPPLEPPQPNQEVPKRSKASGSDRRRKRRRRAKAAASQAPAPCAETPSPDSPKGVKKDNDPRPSLETESGLERDAVVKGATYTWERCEQVGRGSLGTVWRAKVQPGDQIVAVKELHLNRDLNVPTEAAAEVELHRGLSHPNIIKLFGTDSVKASFYIYLEYMPGGSLRQFLKKNGPLTVATTRSYTYQLVRALKSLGLA